MFLQACVKNFVHREEEVYRHPPAETPPSWENKSHNFPLMTLMFAVYYQAYVDELYVMRDLLWRCYIDLESKVTPSVITWNKIPSLKLIQKAHGVTALADKADQRDLPYVVHNLPEVIRDGPLYDSNIQMMAPLDEMCNKLKMVETNLKEYQESIKMDSQFYL